MDGTVMLGDIYIYIDTSDNWAHVTSYPMDGTVMLGDIYIYI